MAPFLQILSGSSSSPTVPESILAFRSITRLISVIQQGRFSNLTHGKLAVEEGRRELTLSVAFAILAALEHEVVAVMAKPTSDGLEAIVCSNSPHDQDRTFLQQIGDKVMDFMFTRNSDRPKEILASGSEYPTFIPTSPPSGLKKENNSKELEDYIEKLRKNNAPTAELPHLRFPLHQHLEVLRQLLTVESTAPQVTKDMLHYVVTTSYMKMNNRMKKSSSIAYLETLTTISMDDLDPVVRRTDQSNNKDQSFLIYLSGFKTDLQKKFPKLYKLGTEALLAQSTKGFKPYTDDTRHFELYSDNTRREFHKLFIMCLQGFASGLRELVDIRHPPKASKPSEDTKGDVRKSFEYYTMFVAHHGQCLSNLARMHAIQLHLRAIVSRYPEPSSAIASALTPMHGEQIAPGEEDAIEPLLPNTDMLPLVKLYLDWLKLIIAEFDAAGVLIQRFVVQGQQPAISIKVVMPSSTNGAALPWKDLFQPSLIFDTLDGGINNEQLLQYLTNIHSAVEPALSWLNRFAESLLSGDTKKTNKLIKEQKQTTPMKMYLTEKHPEEYLWRLWLRVPEQPLLLLPDWAPMLHDLFNALDGWCAYQQLQSLPNEIQRYIDLLRASANFYQKIARTNRTDGFEGKIHCEACLASLVFTIQTIPSVGENVDEQNQGLLKLSDLVKGLGDVIGVSKHCCPACVLLLQLMRPAKGKFHTRGAHNTVSPCSLPLWLPDGVVQHMNHGLGAMLRNELVALIKAPEFHRKRAASTGSSGRSSSSSEQEEIAIIVDWPLQASKA